MVAVVPKFTHQNALACQNRGRHAPRLHNKSFTNKRASEMSHSAVSQAEDHKEEHVAPPPLVAFWRRETIPLCEQERIDSEINGHRYNAQGKQDEAGTFNWYAECDERENWKNARTDKPKKKTSSQSANVNLAVAVHGVIECDRTVAGATGREERRERRQGPDGRSEGGEVPERRAWTESSKN